MEREKNSEKNAENRELNRNLHALQKWLHSLVVGEGAELRWGDDITRIML